MGGIVISPRGTCTCFFSDPVPLAHLFQASKNPIHELELLPVLVAAAEWGHLYSQPLVTYYIRGTGEIAFACRIVQQFASLESGHQHKVWFSRCPSHSNPADGPSRMNVTWVKRMGASRTNISWEKLRNRLDISGETSGRR